ncbi:sugar transferase [Flavobacteriaceae bacterium]|nr:sugar transferase [Flavobacteriaceae bacterium]
MGILLINTEQDFVFKSKTSSISRKKKEIKLQNNFVSKIYTSEIGINTELLNFIKLYFDLSSSSGYLISNSCEINLEKLALEKFSSILNLKKINDVRYINKFFETVNAIMPKMGLYLGVVETLNNRKSAILKKYPPILNRLIYFLDYIFSRLLPKLPIVKSLYFYLTKGKGRVLSKAEIYGRLYSCGFEIVDEKKIDNFLHFVVKKVEEPIYDNNPTYGPIISLKRIGKNNRKFNVYKLRTMHPFSEYLQEYIYKQNSLQAGGKIKDDFRISPEGRFFRRFWIDELPMLINIIKGDMKLVGVRPLSPHFFSLYTKELQELRTQFKPGFIPPFYVDLPKTMDQIMESEKTYLNLCKNSQFKTDLKYFFLAVKNVLFKGVRSN